MQVPCLDMLNHSALTERIGVDVQVIGSDRINIVAIRDLDAAEEVARRSAQRNAARRGAEAPNTACRADSLSRRERLQPRFSVLHPRPPASVRWAGPSRV